MKFHIKTYGCAHNQADSEYMAGVMKEDGFVESSMEDADIVIINSCSVKDPSEKKVFSELDRLKKPVIVAGCVPQADKKNPELQKYSLLGVKQLHNVAEVARQTLDGNIVHLLAFSNDVRLNLPRIRRNPIIEIVPINTGCLGYCTFCKTKLARGGLRSYPKDEIIAQIRSALNQGVKEVWLTSEDTGAYGLDIDTNLPELVREILKIPKDFRIRLGMMNPEHVKRFSDDLIDIMNSDERVFRYLHIPVQAGSNKILKDMKREYTIEEFEGIIDELVGGIPKLTVATDIICGFPTETEQDFQKTIDLVEKYQFGVINISKFYARPGTKAFKMKQLDTKMIKERSKRLTDINRSMDVNDMWLGWEGKILVDETGKGRNLSYKLVSLEGSKPGDFAEVKITEAKRDYLVGVTK